VRIESVRNRWAAADEIETYGRYKAKIALAALDRLKDRPTGR